MAYLPSYDHDIFISYAHVDNVTARGGDGWVKRFHEYLAIELDRRIGRIGSVNIWRDHRLDGSWIVDDLTRTRISRSALFLALTSEGYLQSSYCREELESFYRKAPREPVGLIFGHRSRLFKLLLTDIPHERLPQEFSGLVGFQFYDKETNSPLDVKSEAFHREVSRLADEIHQLLLAMRALKGAERPPADAEGQTVFLAHTEGSLQNVSHRIDNELSQHGVWIIRGIPPPSRAAEHEGAVTAASKSADLCVHLLGESPGLEVVDAPGTFYSARQVELASRSARAQLILIPLNLDVKTIEDEAHRELLLRLESEAHGAELRRWLVREAPSRFARRILEVLALLRREGTTRGPIDTVPKQPLVAPPAARFAVPRDAPAPPRVFICYRRDDSIIHAQWLYMRLTDHFGPERVFMDVTIEPGYDFVDAITEAVASCNVQLVLIGKEWANAEDNGRRRLDDPKDFVRLEVSAALQRKVRVIPVLIMGATMPGEAELPEDLAALARRNAFVTSKERWPQDVETLVDFLEKRLTR